MQLHHLVMTQLLTLPCHAVQGEEQDDQDRQPPQDIAWFIEHFVGHSDDRYDQCRKTDRRVEEHEHGPYGRPWTVQAA